LGSEQYGEKFKDHLLEQYKLYVEMADRVSNRRAQTNQFYVSVISALLGIVTIASSIVGNQILTSTKLSNTAFLAVSLLGLFLCTIWFINIFSYRQLNSGKFQVIHEIEQWLPYACYDREWIVLGKGRDVRKYLPLTHVEQYVPVLLAIPFFLVLVLRLRG
jgi:hypothetical protein